MVLKLKALPVDFSIYIQLYTSPYPSRQCTALLSLHASCRMPNLDQYCDSARYWRAACKIGGAMDTGIALHGIS